MLGNRGSAPILILIFAILLITLTGGAYYLGRQNTASNSTAAVPESYDASPKPAILPSPVNSSTIPIKNIEYLSNYSSANQGYDRKVFITRNDQSQDLKIADTSLSPGSIKTLYSVPLGAIGIYSPIYMAGTNLIVQTGGADTSDILIFTADGETVTDSVKSDNPELASWIISYSGKPKDLNTIVIDLYRIDNSQGTAELESKTGKLIPGSIKIIR